eukprot:11816103-Heterocapsa_arctica.AAC.1
MAVNPPCNGKGAGLGVGSARWPGHLSVVSYNPLTSAAAGRAGEIEKVFEKDSIICLQGTQKAQSHRSSSYSQNFVGKHWFIEWGWGRGD